MRGRCPTCTFQASSFLELYLSFYYTIDHKKGTTLEGPSRGRRLRTHGEQFRCPACPHSGRGGVIGFHFKRVEAPFGMISGRFRYDHLGF